MSDPRKALAAVEELSTLLRREIAAVERGVFDHLVTFASEKARMTAELEKHLTENPEAVSKDKLRDLRDLVMRDRDHLQLARRAILEVAEEVTKVREKHSIAGMYGRKGGKYDSTTTLNANVDKTF